MDSRFTIVGAGPVGLSLALGLARHGVRSVLIEKDGGTSPHSRAPGILPRTLEIFEQWGVARRILDEGIFLAEPAAWGGESDRPLVTLQVGSLADECRHAGLCILEQGRTERILLEALLATGLCEVRFGHRLTGCEQGESGVTATVRDGGGSYRLTSDWLIGCDGASSSVRDLLGLPFDGITYPVDAVLADVRFNDRRRDLPFPRVAADGPRTLLGIRLESGAWRLIRIERNEGERSREVAAPEIAGIARLLAGDGPFETVWASRFRLHRRCVPRFRVGRILLAGDAAHVNSPVGAEGMNAGIHDAHNLAWKLAAIAGGGDAERLAESYHAERHDAITREVNRFTDRLTRAVTAPYLLRLLAGRVARRALSISPLRRRLLRRMSMLSLTYAGSPLLEGSGSGVGERVPDVVLESDEGSRRLHELIGTEGAVVSLGGSIPDETGGLPRIVVGEELRDGSGLLVRRFGRNAVLLVRPDHFVGWSGSAEPGRLEAIAARVLGRPFLR